MPFSSNNTAARLAAEMANAVLNDDHSMLTTLDNSVDHDLMACRIQTLLERTVPLTREEQQELEGLLTQQEDSEPSSPVRSNSTASSENDTSLRNYMQKLIQEKKKQNNIDTSTEDSSERMIISLTCSLSIISAILQHEPAFTDLTPDRRADLLGIHDQLLAEISQCKQAMKNVQTPTAGGASSFFSNSNAEQYPTLKGPASRQETGPSFKQH